MALSEDQVEQELLKTRAVVIQAHKLEEFAQAVLKGIRKDDPLWAETDPTAGQKQAWLAKYDSLKTDLKAIVAAY